MRILVHHEASPGFVAALERARPTDAELVFVAESDRDGLARALPGCDALFHVLEPLDRAVLALGARLRLVQKIGVGVNTIDLVACRELGIGVANMPGTNTQAVAEMTLALALAAIRRLPELDRDLRAGRGFPADPQVLDAVTELQGATVGLVGWGAVARRVAALVTAFGAAVVVHTRRPQEVQGYEALALDELLARSDLVSLHLPLTDESRLLLSRDRLRRMRRGAVLVNTARGGLVDQAALVDALREGHLRAAGLDVFADEPVPADEPLLRLPQVALAPHVAWRTRETLDRSFSIAFENARRAAIGEELLHGIVPVGRAP